jgi:hypothetical protein
MRRDEDIGAQQRDRTRVFNYVVVPTNQDAYPHSQRGIKNSVAIAAVDVLVLEHMELAMAVDCLVWLANEIRIEQPSVDPSFNQSCAYGDLIVAGERRDSFDRLATWHRFRKAVQSLAAQVSDVPVAGDAHFRERENLHPLASGLQHKFLDGRQIVDLVIGTVTELHCAASESSHFWPPGTSGK